MTHEEPTEDRRRADRRSGLVPRLSKGRRREDRIVDITTHPRSSVCLAVAAEFLELDKRTVRARIDDGSLRAWKDAANGTIRVDLHVLLAYQDKRRQAAT